MASPAEVGGIAVAGPRESAAHQRSTCRPKPNPASKMMTVSRLLVVQAEMRRANCAKSAARPRRRAAPRPSSGPRFRAARLP